MMAQALPAVVLGGWNLVQHRRLTATRIDPATGVWTRAGFAARAARALRRRRDLVLLLVDGDGLKAINDTHGHDVGDLAITALASRLKAFAAGRGAVGRHGGDEFVVLLHTGPGQDLTGLLDGLCASLAAPLVLDAQRVNFGASVGAVRIGTLADPSLPQALKAADLALYQVKNGTRGTWHLADPDPAFHPIEPDPLRRTRHQ
jgi:diguanylate cyclase (GGDEF)-like protein